MVVEEVKEELKKLCTDYLNILQQLKNEDLISEETFEKCSITNLRSSMSFKFVLCLSS